MVFVFKKVRFGVAWGFISRGGKFGDGLSIDGHGTPHCHQRKSQVQRSSGKEGFEVKKSRCQQGKHDDDDDDDDYDDDDDDDDEHEKSRKDAARFGGDVLYMISNIKKRWRISFR